MGKKKSKGKKVGFELIPRGHEAYALLVQARIWHSSIFEARIALAWRLEVKPDTDGKIVLGKCVKVSDFQKEFADYDFIIVLNKTYWFGFSEPQQLALLDHELSHAATARDRETGEQIIDTRGRPVWRVHKHDIEEFSKVVERHGTWKRDLQAFAEAMDRHRDSQGDLIEHIAEQEVEPEPGDELEVIIESGGERVKTTGKTVRECFEKGVVEKVAKRILQETRV